MNNLDKLRESFETEYKDVLNFELGAAGGYKNFMTFVAFRAYQSAHISAVKQCAEIDNDYGCSSKDEWIAKYGDITEQEAILALLPKGNEEVSK